MQRADKRLVYILDPDASGNLNCMLQRTTLMKWDRFEALAVKALSQCLQASSGLQLSDEDRKLLPRLIQCESRDFIGAVLRDTDGYELVAAMVATGRAFLLHGNRIRLSWGNALQAKPVWQSAADGVEQPAWACDESVRALIATTPPCYIGSQNGKDCIGPLKTPWSSAAAQAWTGVRCADADAVERFIARFIHRHPESVPPQRDTPADATAMSQPPVPVLRIVARDSALHRSGTAMLAVDQLLLLRLQFRYGNREVSWQDDRPNVGLRIEGKTHIVPRKVEFEADCVQQLVRLGLRARPGTAASLFDFNANDFELDSTAPNTWATLLNEAFPRLEAEGWEWLHDPQLRFAPIQASQLVVGSESADNATQWQSFAATIHYRGRSVPVLPLLRDFIRTHHALSRTQLKELFATASFAIPNADAETLFVPGSFLLPLIDALFELGLQRPLDRAGRLRVSNWRVREIAASMASLSESANPVPGLAAPNSASAHTADRALDLAVLRQRLLAGEHPFAARPDPRRQFAELRDYQCTGIGWMEFLDTIDANGILADDMGLGKTFQMLAYIARRKRQKKAPHAPVLIVCPTSVMDSWLAEAKARVPKLRCNRHHGPNRRNCFADLLRQSDLLITNYPSLREDGELLAATEWDLIVLDEAQTIKNADSQTYQAAQSLRARRRFCLTGTPMENRLGELWALMHFLMPFYLGTREDFREEFERPCAADPNSTLARERAQLLADRLAPFVLRRNKLQVAPQLPARTEICHWVDLSPLQAQRYEAVRASMVSDIRTLLQSRSIAAAQIHILEALTRLRLICCDPRIGSSGNAELAAEHSAKFERLFELLEELLAEGRRILVFSQFVQMLDLIGAEVESRQWPHRVLTGQTRDRREPVAAFQSGEVPILLLSLKAGGSGLNLTTADSVILYDPWWNPAVERQAGDRAHRIGQTNPVFIHRLIARGTVEEGMLALQERKRQLIEQVLQGLPGDAISLDADTLAALLGEAVDRAL